MIHYFKTTQTNLVLTLSAALIALASPGLAEDGPTEAPYTYRAEVVEVIDGDTIDVHLDLGFYVFRQYCWRL